MRLLIDDVRQLPADCVARTPEAGREALRKGGWSVLLLDHDLGEDYGPFAEDYWEDGMAYAENGYGILQWGLDRNLIPDTVELVSSNPSGRHNITRALVAEGWVQKNLNVLIRCPGPETNSQKARREYFEGVKSGKFQDRFVFPDPEEDLEDLEDLET